MPTLFSSDQLTATGSETSVELAVSQLERRRRAWKHHSSPLSFRGFDRFGSWLQSMSGRVQVSLDLTALEDWRREASIAAMKNLISFLDGAGADPGPLLTGDENVGWKKREKGLLLEARTPSGWPGELPLFARAWSNFFWRQPVFHRFEKGRGKNGGL